jgi:hypothetical protein
MGYFFLNLLTFGRAIHYVESINGIVNFKEYNLTGQILDLVFRDHQFESYKLQDH